MLPPNNDCNPPKKLPTIERERTVMPRTIPRFLVTVCPGNENAPVIIDRCIGFSSEGRSRRRSARDQRARSERSVGGLAADVGRNGVRDEARGMRLVVH